MNIESLIIGVQQEIGVMADGKPGPRTWEAIYKRVCGGESAAGQPATPPEDCGEMVDERSEKSIVTLQPEVRPYARALVKKAASMEITIKVISGLRTYEEQDDLYAQGRTKSGCIVTRARGGYSNHNFGIAFDIGVFNGSRYVEESPVYKAIGAIGTDLGLDWGGNWKSIKDEPHFQLRPGWAKENSESEMLAQLRKRMSAGGAVYV